MLPLRILAREQLLYPSEETLARTCCHTAARKGTVRVQFWLFKENKTKNEGDFIRLNSVVLTFHIYSPKEAISLSSTVCEMCFEFYNHYFIPWQKMSPWVHECAYGPKRFFIVPANTLQPAVCAVTQWNAIIVKKRTIKEKGNLKKTVSRKVNKKGSYLHG